MMARESRAGHDLDFAVYNNTGLFSVLAIESYAKLVEQSGNYQNCP